MFKYYVTYGWTHKGGNIQYLNSGFMNVDFKVKDNQSLVKLREMAKLHLNDLVLEQNLDINSLKIINFRRTI